jgi:chromosome segregation ATPase
MYNYNKINNFNNNINNTNNYFHPLMNKTYTQNFIPNPNNIIKVNKLMDNNQSRKNTNNNVYSPSNTDSNINYSQYNTTIKRTKDNNNAGFTKNIVKSEKKSMNNKKINIISNKIKKLRDDNIKNKNDLFNLGHIYNEMQKILLQEISRYEKYPKELTDIKKELNDYKNKYTLLLESDKKLSEEKDSKINELLNQVNQLKETNKNLELKIKELKELNELMKGKNTDVPDMVRTPQKELNSHYRTVSDKSQKLLYYRKLGFGKFL